MKTYSVEELFDIDAEEQEQELVVKVQELRKVLSEVDATFAVCSVCDDLTPQARKAIADSWPLIRKFMEETAPQVFFVTSSNGTLTVDAISGKVIKCSMNKGGTDIDKIVRFNVDEWKNHYVQGNMKGLTIDILDLGDWDKEGNYNAPESSWREDFRNDSDIQEQINQRTEALAKAFGAKILEWIGPSEMAEVVRLNKAEKDSRICHSHDFCDANQAMLDVFEEVGLDALKHDELSAKVWNLAKKNDLYFDLFDAIDKEDENRLFRVSDLSGRGFKPAEMTTTEVQNAYSDELADEDEDDEDSLTYFLATAEVGDKYNELSAAKFERIR